MVSIIFLDKSYESSKSRSPAPLRREKVTHNTTTNSTQNACPYPGGGGPSLLFPPSLLEYSLTACPGGAYCDPYGAGGVDDDGPPGLTRESIDGPPAPPAAKTRSSIGDGGLSMRPIGSRSCHGGRHGDMGGGGGQEAG